MRLRINVGGTLLAGEAESQTNLLTGQFLSVIRCGKIIIISKIHIMATPMNALSIRQNMS